MNIALFDLDGSLADFDGAMARDLEAIASPGSDYDYKNFRALEHLPWITARMELIKNQPGWWYRLKPIRAGFAVFAAAKRIGFECQFLTKGPSKHPTAWKEKVEWCQEYFPGHSINIVGNKGLTYGKVLYDDYDKYMTDWLNYRPRGLGIMPTNESNKDFHHPNVIKYYHDNLDEVIEALQRAYDR